MQFSQLTSNFWVCTVVVLICGSLVHTVAESTLEWTYINNAETLATCGDVALGEEECGPNNWGKAFHECGIAGSESPINIDEHHLHASHELDELRWKLSECAEATLMLNTHNWRIEFAAACGEAFKITRFGHTYRAHAIEFHSPSEHTFDDEHKSMEVQIIHRAPGDHKLTVAVVLEAKSVYFDNIFLAPFWKLVQTTMLNTTFETSSSASAKSASGSQSSESENITIVPLPTFTATSADFNFTHDELNFVDYLLPSSGLNFDYILYEGTSTSPDCVEMKWVVLKHPGRMSIKQLEFFLSTMVSVSHTQARGDGSNNRLIQELGHRELELFHDADCYIRFCHKIFSLGQLLHIPTTGIFLTILIIFTILFESLSQYAEHKVARLRTAREMLAKVHKELSVLGLVSFLTFAINSSCAVSFEGTEVEFEFAHIMLFAVAILYVCFSGMLMLFTSFSSKNWDKILILSGEELIHFVESPRYLMKPTSWIIFGRLSQTLDLGIFYSHHLFLKQYNLQDNFDFLKYLKYCLSFNIKQKLDISAKEWMVMIAIFVLWGVWCYFEDVHTAYPAIGCLNVVIVFVNWVLCMLSFKKMLLLLEIDSYDELKNKVRERKAHKTKPDLAKQLLQANPNATVNSDTTGKEAASNDEATKKRLQEMLTPRNSKTDVNSRDASHQKVEMKKLQKCWVPGGSPRLIRSITDSALLAQCFYAGFFALNARAYLTGFESFIVISSIIVIVCIILPFVYLTITAIQSLVEPNFDLIGEVVEYTEELHQLRTNLVNTLFPPLNARLMSDMTMAEAEHLLTFFDMDGDCSIDIGEFAHGCQMLGLRMSESKARRFFRMVDTDRNGIIDGEELFDIIWQERIIRTDEQLVNAFQELCPNMEIADRIPFKSIYSALKKSFRSDDQYGSKQVSELTKLVVAELAKKFGNKELSDVHIFDLREALIAVLNATKIKVADVQALVQGQGRKHLNQLQVWALRREAGQKSKPGSPVSQKDHHNDDGHSNAGHRASTSSHGGGHGGEKRRDSRKSHSAIEMPIVVGDDGEKKEKTHKRRSHGKDSNKRGDDTTEKKKKSVERRKSVDRTGSGGFASATLVESDID